MLQNKLNLYICVLALHIANYKVRVQHLAAELKLSVKKYVATWCVDALHTTGILSCFTLELVS